MNERVSWSRVRCSGIMYLRDESGIARVSAGGVILAMVGEREKEKVGHCSSRYSGMRVVVIQAHRKRRTGICHTRDESMPAQSCAVLP